jgi:NitT/TauT family transport system substrate-binding protein
MKKSIKVILSVVGLLVVILLGFNLLRKPAKKPKLNHIRIGYQPSTHQIAHIIAMEKGWWQSELKKFGVEEITEHLFPSGPPEMTAMLAGELDIVYVGTAPPITAIYEGLDAKIVASVQTQGSHLVLRPDIDYKGPQELKGLRIATFPPGSIQDTVLGKWLKDNGLDPKKDLEIAPMGPGDAISAIKAKAVDGAFLPHPAPAVIELEKSGKMVVASGKMWPDHACCCLLASKQLIQEYPELLKQIIRTHIRATEYAISHKEEAAEIYAKKMGWDIKKIKYALKTTDERWIHDPHIMVKSTLDFANVIYELNKPRYTKVLTEKDLFDTSFYDEVAK